MDTLSKLIYDDYESLDYLIFKKDNEIVLYDVKTNSVYARYKITRVEDEIKK